MKRFFVFLLVFCIFGFVFAEAKTITLCPGQEARFQIIDNMPGIKKLKETDIPLKEHGFFLIITYLGCIGSQTVVVSYYCMEVKKNDLVSNPKQGPIFLTFPTSKILVPTSVGSFQVYLFFVSAFDGQIGLQLIEMEEEK